MPLSLSLSQVWCLSSGGEHGHHINRTVDGAVLSILLTGLLPDTRYAVSVAAVTSLGVGAQSPPVSLLLSESPELLRGAVLTALCPLVSSAVKRRRQNWPRLCYKCENANCYSVYRSQAVNYV